MAGCGGRNGGSSANDHHHQLHDPHKHDDDRLLMTPIGRIGGEPKVTLGIADGCADDPNQPKVTILSLFPPLLLSSSSVLSISRNDRRSLDRCCCCCSSSPSMAIRRGNYNMGVEQLNCSESSHLNPSRDHRHGTEEPIAHQSGSSCACPLWQSTELSLVTDSRSLVGQTMRHAARR